ncbi:MAG: hypothetical protein OES23_00180 [Nitrosopumilus sp.]|nr:hypothetical protein [Nitrosopumilus sp.]
MSSNIKPIDELGIVDSYFGLMSAVSAIREHTQDPNKPVFDVHEFLIRMRQNMVLHESFCGECYQDKESKLCSLTKPDFLLFEKGIDHSNLKEFNFDVFRNIRNKVCNHKPDHIITKNQSFLEILHEQNLILPYLDESIKTMIDASNRKFLDDITLNRFSAIPNPHRFKKQVEITNKFSNEFNEFSIKDYVSKRKPRLDKAMLESYVCHYTIPLVGTLRAYPDQTVLYVMSHYKKYGKKENLANISNYMDKLLPYVLEYHPKMRECITDCVHLCDNKRKEVVITKMLARRKSSLGICIIFFVSFLKDIVRGRQRLLPIRNLYNDFRENLGDEWDSYMGGYKKFDLK